jgi:methyl acetate hydrolase
VTEPGTAYAYAGYFSPRKIIQAHILRTLNISYSGAADWLGQFAVRSTGKHLRQLFKEIVFEPLSIPPSEADIWISPSLSEAKADMHIRDPDKGFTRIPLSVYATEERPPDGKSYYAGGCVFASLQAYAKVLQAVLVQDSRILSLGIWKMAMKDDLKDRGVKMPRSEWKSNMLDLTPEYVTCFLRVSQARRNMAKRVAV